MQSDDLGTNFNTAGNLIFSAIIKSQDDGYFVGKVKEIKPSQGY